MKIVAADSGAAILDEHFEPTQVVATCIVLVEQPYTKATSCVVKPIFLKAENGYELVVNELELCMNFLKTIKADIVHLDISLGSLSLEELSPVSLSQLHVSGKARENIQKFFPD